MGCASAAAAGPAERQQQEAQQMYPVHLEWKLTSIA